MPTSTALLAGSLLMQLCGRDVLSSKWPAGRGMLLPSLESISMIWLVTEPNVVPKMLNDLKRLMVTARTRSFTILVRGVKN